MFGSILSSVVKVATLPVDVVESVVSVATDGANDDLNVLSKVRDKVCEEIEDLDE